MKIVELLFFTILLLPLALPAQQEQSVITVSGYALHKDPTPTYKAIMSLGNLYSSLPSDIISLKAMQEQYREALEAKGIAWSALKENPYDFGYETLGYENQGIIYSYETTSASDMKKFMQVKTHGVQRLNIIAVFTIDSEEGKGLTKEALRNAHEKAQTIANAMGKELGPVQTVEDFNGKWGENIETTLYYDKDPAVHHYTLSVTYLMWE
ncbi:DUF541 domain-containing protein [Maribacter algicola]|uniref:DUF541 domain-containing protein n=1 Tax=Maribacter algicola TaxID=2498892 RepID=A0A3R8Q2V1_9FLAO|nr:SIMPL domain-containing protein [Maribacter algicola]RRQ48650.1 DUF541 domain-containing protein [Maribacter algicola]